MASYSDGLLSLCVLCVYCVCTVCVYLVADLLPLPLQQLHALLQDRQVLRSDVAGQGLPEETQVGQVVGPARKPALQLLEHQFTSSHWFSHYFYPWGLFEGGRGGGLPLNNV